MKLNNKQDGFAVLVFAIALALAGAFATGAVSLDTKNKTLATNKAAAMQAFKSGKPSDYANLNK